MHDIPSLSVSDLAERYDALLLDAYGVLVSLDGALPGAAALIDRLNRQGKPYWLVSNTAARLPEHAAARYRGFGLDIPAERILTSGMLLGPCFMTSGLTGRRILVLGPEDSLRYVERAGGAPVPPGEDFDALVLADQAGFPCVETLDQVISSLIEQLDAGGTVPLILPNPDLVYPKGRGYGITAGALAVMLEAILARRYPDRDDVAFVRLGKPHPALFEAAARAAGGGRLVMIGDQLETDILGANAFGIDSALVLGGVAGRRPRIVAGGPTPSYLLASLAD
jgi:HAD superfamily hydrolase (TIGR01450 family)